MSKIKLVSGTANLDKAIGTFHKSATRLQSTMHTLACSVLAHAIDHGDIRPMAKFIQAMPASGRVKALIAWLENYGPVTFDKDVPTYSKARKAKANLAGAMAEPFWVFAPEPDYKAIDLVKLIQSTIKKLEKDQEVVKTDHSAFINVLKAQLQPQVGNIAQ